MKDQILYHNISLNDIYQHLNTSTLGLSSQEFKKRLELYGYNELPIKKKKSLISHFLGQFNDFMIIVLIIAAIISYIASILEGNADFVDPIIIMTIIIFNAIVGVIQESKAEHSLESLKKLSAPYASVVRDGVLTVIPARELVTGDIIHLDTGNFVPADVRLIDTTNLLIDESSLTGESVPVSKYHNLTLAADTPLADRKNIAYSSSIVTSGHGIGIVIATGTDTQVGHIAKLITEDNTPNTPLQKSLATTSKYLGIIALCICLVIFIIGVIQGRSILQMFMTSISLAVASIPEGLPIIVTIVLSLGVTKMAEHKAIIRKLPAVETLGSATYICSDKTGTLTQNKMTVTKICDINGPIKNIDFILTLASLCNNSVISNNNLNISKTTPNTTNRYNSSNITDDFKKYTVHGEPTENALLYAAINNKLIKNELEELYPRIYEIPFDSKRKLMSTIHAVNSSTDLYTSSINNTYRYITKGALEIILSSCSNYYDGININPLTDTIKNRITKTCNSMTKEALRVIAIAYKDSNNYNTATVEKDLCFVGMIGMIDPPRSEVYSAVKDCKSAGITPVMITGDHPYTAFAIAKQLNICTSEQEILTGKELDSIDDEELNIKVKNYKVFARVTPHHKVKIVKALQQNNEVIAMTGDGVNDAPALKAADIGCAMGINGTDVAKSASDMILSDDNFATIVEAIKQGRGIYENIRKSIHFLLSCNIGEIISILFAILFRLPTPLLAVQLLWINLVTDSLPAISLGLEPIDKDILYKKKHTSHTGFFTKELVVKIIFEGFMIGLLTLIAFIIGYKLYPILSPHNTAYNTTLNIPLITGRTMAFATLGLSQLIHSFNMKSDLSLFTKNIASSYNTHKKNLILNIFNNKKLIISFIICTLLQVSVISIETLATIFKVIPLDFIHWFIVCIISFLPIPIVELQKKINCR